MNSREKILLYQSADPAVDAMIANIVKVLPVECTSEEIQRACDAVRKIMPYADPVYISYQISKMRANNAQKLNILNSSETVEGYAHLLLQDNTKGLPKSVYNSSSDTLQRQNSGNNFNMTDLTGVLNGLQEKESYDEELSSPNMVIHVCDEAKNLKQDFDCPRDLLIQEMRYFAEYLSVESQRLEEVDISVHCDIHIFDWLMRYVKRGTKLIDENDVPKLDPNNVISILISSDFLKMNTLVEACISYCHKNMSAIIATPCNMNCVNDKLTVQIAEKFNHNELEEIKDRKDKFKSKLFCKKIEKLFDSSISNLDSPGKGSSLFKCSICQRVLTVELNSKLPCTNNRLSVGSRGCLAYQHEPQSQWDINNYIISLFEELHKWNLVYWRLWGIINHLTCSRCGVTFQLCDFGNCMHHPERPQYRIINGGDLSESPVGIFPCCNQQVLRFDPTGINNGCRSKDHIITPQNNEEQQILDDFVAHKSLIKASLLVNDSSSGLNIFASEELRCSIKEATMTPIEISSAIILTPSASSTFGIQKMNLKKLNLASENDDEDVAGEDDVAPLRKSSTQLSLNLSLNRPSSGSATGSDNRAMIGSKKKEKTQLPSDSTSYRKYPLKQRWDSARSIRFNQDIQREEDRRRMTSITTTLAKQRLSEKIDKTKLKDPKELPGGIFMKLEQAFMNNLKSQGGSHIQNLSRQYGKDFKQKSRR